MIRAAWPRMEHRTGADTRLPSGFPRVSRGSASMVGRADTSGRTQKRSP